MQPKVLIELPLQSHRLSAGYLMTSGPPANEAIAIVIYLSIAPIQGLANGKARSHSAHPFTVKQNFPIWIDHFSQCSLTQERLQGQKRRTGNVAYVSVR